MKNSYLFYSDQMEQHKIQSSEGLHLELQQVPKMLGKLTSEWAPMVVAFIVFNQMEFE